MEFLARPRPCVFLNPDRLDWRAAGDHDFWTCGDVVDRLEEIEPALLAAPGRHGLYREVQRRFAADALGDCTADAPMRAAKIILEGLAA